MSKIFWMNRAPNGHITGRNAIGILPRGTIVPTTVTWVSGITGWHLTTYLEAPDYETAKAAAAERFAKHEGDAT